LSSLLVKRNLAGHRANQTTGPSRASVYRPTAKLLLSHLGSTRDVLSNLNRKCFRSDRVAEPAEHYCCCETGPMSSMLWTLPGRVTVERGIR
jgi:hypothetical protein